MPPRSLDRVTLSFGLVSIPTKVYSSAEHGTSIRFHYLHATCGNRVKQHYWCPYHEADVDRDELVKGYEYEKGKYVEVSKEELDALKAVSTSTIEIREFVDATTIDPIWLDKTYYLGPDAGGEKAYALLAKALARTGLVALASYAARGHAYVVMIRPYEQGIVMHQLHFPDELRAWEEVPLGDLPRVRGPELELAERVIAQGKADAFRPEQYHDVVKERMRAALERKVEAGEEIVAPEAAPQPEVVDLMQALEASLGQGGKGGKGGQAGKDGHARTQRSKRTSRAAKRPAKRATSRSRPAARSRSGGRAHAAPRPRR